MTRYTIRFPDDLYEQVKTAAAAQRRSAHEEILWLIERGLETPPTTSDSPTA
ncbi:MAG: Arc family DNA-binding protein [Pseudonocardiaceae bacterium]